MEPWFPSVDSVRTLIETTLTDAQIQELMVDAWVMTQACIEDLPDATKATIVKYVTAHIISGLPSSAGGGTGAVTSESLGDASVSYATRELGSDLRGSTYGQMAIALDRSGCLARLGKGTATIDVLRFGCRQ